MPLWISTSLKASFWTYFRLISNGRRPAERVSLGNAKRETVRMICTLRLPRDVHARGSEWVRPSEINYGSQLRSKYVHELLACPLCLSLFFLGHLRALLLPLGVSSWEPLTRAVRGAFAHRLPSCLLVGSDEIFDIILWWNLDFSLIELTLYVRVLLYVTRYLCTLNISLR